VVGAVVGVDVVVVMILVAAACGVETSHPLFFLL
jgi:hypothetical protein